jgi:hypothetical protein
VARRDHAGEWHRVGPRRRTALARARERRRDGGVAVPRGDQPPRAHACAIGARSRPSPLRGVAAPRTASARCARAPPYGLRDARRDERNALTDRAEREVLATGETVRKRTAAIADQLTSQEPKSHGSRATASRTQRLAPACSSVREPSSTTCARCSRNSTSRGANISGPRSPIGRPTCSARRAYKEAVDHPWYSGLLLARIAAALSDRVIAAATAPWAGGNWTGDRRRVGGRQRRLRRRCPLTPPSCESPE